MYREQRGGEPVAVIDMLDGSRQVLPAWMLDRDACKGLARGEPRASLRGLLDLRSVLEGVMQDGDDRPDDEPQQEASSDRTAAGQSKRREAGRKRARGSKAPTRKASTRSGRRPGRGGRSQ